MVLRYVGPRHPIHHLRREMDRLLNGVLSSVSETMPRRTTRIVFGSQLFRTSPNATPAAGGCSMSVSTIRKIASPTAAAPNAALDMLVVAAMSFKKGSAEM